MDKKFVVALGTSAISMLVASDAVFALTPDAAMASTQTPALVTLTPAAAGDYVQSQFTFQRSANTAL